MNTAGEEQNQLESITRGKSHSRIARTSLKSKGKSTNGNHARNKKKNRLHKKKMERNDRKDSAIEPKTVNHEQQ